MKPILLPGEPTAQQRARVFAKGAMDPCWKAKEQHRSYIRDHYSPLLITEPVELHLFFFYGYLKSSSKKSRIPHWKASRPDLDNLVKYIMDMANGLLWEDDSIISTIYATKIYTDESCTVLHFRDASQGNMLANLAYLAAAKEKK